MDTDEEYAEKLAQVIAIAKKGCHKCGAPFPAADSRRAALEKYVRVNLGLDGYCYCDSCKTVPPVTPSQ